MDVQKSTGGESFFFDVLFDKFNQYLKDNNQIMNEGIIINGSFVEVACQRNSREENRLIKEGKGDGLWNEEEGDTEDDKKTEGQQENWCGWNMCSGIWRRACTGCTAGRWVFSEIPPRSSSCVWSTTC